MEEATLGRDKPSRAKSYASALKSSKAGDLYQRDIDVMCENAKIFRICSPSHTPLHHLLIAVRPAEMKRHPLPALSDLDRRFVDL